MTTTTKVYTPAERLRIWLNPQTQAEQQVVDYMITVAPSQLPTLVGMLEREIRQSMRDAGDTARHECLTAVQSVVDEIEGKR